MSAGISTKDLLVPETRRTVYVHGRALVNTMVKRRGVGEQHAVSMAAGYTARYPAAESGLRFDYEPIPHLHSTWGIYAYPVPIITGNRDWTQAEVDALGEALEVRGPVVLVRLVGSSQTARSRAHRDNHVMPDKDPELAAYQFRPRVIGHTSKVYGELAERKTPEEWEDQW